MSHALCFAHHIYRKSLHNYAHPRTDAVVIMIAVDDTEDKVLLGRGVSPFYIKIPHTHRRPF